MGECYLLMATLLLLSPAREACVHAEDCGQKAVERMFGGVALGRAYATHAVALERLGRTGCAQAARRAACSVFESGGAHTDEHVEVLLDAASAHETQGHVTDALACARKAVQLATGETEAQQLETVAAVSTPRAAAATARARLAAICAAAGDCRAATEHYERAIV